MLLNVFGVHEVADVESISVLKAVAWHGTQSFQSFSSLLVPSMLMCDPAPHEMGGTLTEQKLAVDWSNPWYVPGGQVTHK